MRSPFSIKWIYLIERRSFGQKYKFSDKNDMVSAYRNFKNIFSSPLFTINFRPEMLKFHSYSILTGDTMVGFVIFCVLNLSYTVLNYQYSGQTSLQLLPMLKSNHQTKIQVLFQRKFKTWTFLIVQNVLIKTLKFKL